MKIGVFDHFDTDGGALATQYEWRRKLIEAYDRSGEAQRSLELFTDEVRPGLARAESPDLGNSTKQAARS